MQEEGSRTGRVLAERIKDFWPGRAQSGVRRADASARPRPARQWSAGGGCGTLTREPGAALAARIFPLQRQMLWLLILVVAALFLFFTDLHRPGFQTNEGRYAEVAREILTTGDWITLHVNGEVYLNKPPLTFWLIALVYHVTGLNEAARALSGLACVGTLLLLFDLGRRLWRPAAGVWAAAVFLTAVGTPIEARILRPDPLLVFFLCLTLWGAARVSLADRHAVDRLGQGAIWVGIGLAVLTKGLLGLLLPALALLPALLLAGRFREVRRYCPGWSVLLAVLLVLPWHVAAALRNPGFAWDYVVNQHLLYFFDQKQPRDSVPDPLWYIWAVFAGRMMPWTLFLPGALLAQFRQAREQRGVLDWLPLTWFGAVGGLFSLSNSHLEHYLLPAVPPCCLVIGNLCASWVTEGEGRRPSAARLLPFALLASAGLLGLWLLAPVLRVVGLLHLTDIGRVGVDVLLAGSLLALMFAATRRFRLAFGVVAATFIALGGISHLCWDAEDEAASPRALIARQDPALLAASRIAYEPSIEYQLCGVLDFYLRRKILLLEPSGFVPPTYLKPEADRLFVQRAAFWNAWRQGRHRFLLFTDPERGTDRLAQFPQPCYLLDRNATQLLLTNQPPPRSGAASAGIPPGNGRGYGWRALTAPHPTGRPTRGSS